MMVTTLVRVNIAMTANNRTTILIHLDSRIHIRSNFASRELTAEPGGAGAGESLSARRGVGALVFRAAEGLWEFLLVLVGRRCSQRELVARPRPQPLSMIRASSQGEVQIVVAHRVSGPQLKGIRGIHVWL